MELTTSAFASGANVSSLCTNAFASPCSGRYCRNSGVVDAHHCTVTRPNEETGSDECVHQRRTRGRVEAPETPRLSFCQTESRHLEEFPLDAVEGRVD